MRMGTATAFATAIILTAGAPKAWAEDCRGCEAAKVLHEALVKVTPQRIDRLQTLSSALRNGNVVRAVMQIDVPPEKLNQNFTTREAALREAEKNDALVFCNNPKMKRFFDEGVIVQTVYISSKTLEEYFTTVSDIGDCK